ncbi:hypothetical protein Nepgr_012798 [Nepenthes gracilis]|uniref:BZIP domain-containing protein n=1 Tax=Nepenthes gracilis TaxID=150966 RepID=A0AAD3SGR5_NEPGR|nr:hypothetical protein Nepgr_012798 [Nepenthes gracilis]
MEDINKTTTMGQLGNKKENYDRRASLNDFQDPKVHTKSSISSLAPSFNVCNNPYFANNSACISMFTTYFEPSNHESMPLSRNGNNPIIISPCLHSEALGFVNGVSSGDCDGGDASHMLPQNIFQTEVGGCQKSTPNMNQKMQEIKKKRTAAQKFRLKKAQYIMNMQKKWIELEAKLAALSPLVQAQEHEYLLLKRENDLLNQRLAAAQDYEKIKEAIIEQKKAEVKRLTQNYTVAQQLLELEEIMLIADP